MHLTTRFFAWLAGLVLYCLLHSSCVQAVGEPVVDVPAVALTKIPFSVTVTLEQTGPAQLLINGEPVADSAGSSVLRAEDVTIPARGTAVVAIRAGDSVRTLVEFPVIPGWVSLLPPLIAIVLAFMLRSVIPALFIGLWAGAWAVNGLTPMGAWTGLFEAVSTYVVDTAIDHDHMTIMIFTFMIGGMVGIISKNGGMVGIVRRIMPYASTPKRGQGLIASLGLVIFFDDYANTMIVGNATRSVSDRLGISREKLAYLVDSTAAPVSTIAVITTWIGFQVGLIGTAIENIDGIDDSPYLLFLQSIPYSFYPFLAIFLVFLVVFSGKDFGPMVAAEHRARRERHAVFGSVLKGVDVTEGEFGHKPGIPCRALNGIIPIATLIVTIVGGLFISGEGDTVTDIIGSANSYIVLIWASLLSCAVAAALTLGQRILTLNELVEAWLVGVRFMLTGLVLLVLAWAVADVAAVLQTAPYLVSILGDSLSPHTLPAIVFVLAAATAFASGSSWGVMAILMPLVIPLCWAVLVNHGMTGPEHMHILYSCIACVLTGAVWADHCSPISDTTVLSSLATGCDHMEHVRTQIPYALLGGGAALLVGVLPTGYGLPWFLTLPVAAAVIYVGHRFLGRQTE